MYYTSQLLEVKGNDFSQAFRIGTRNISIHFRWDTAIQEQYDMYTRALTARAQSDPLLQDSAIIRDYNWIDYYLSLPAYTAQIEVYLEQQGSYPQSLKDLDIPHKASILYKRRLEAIELDELMEPYRDMLVWHIEVTDDEDNAFVGTVTPGGWINNQGSWSLQCVSSLQSVGYNDLLKVVFRWELKE